MSCVAAMSRRESIYLDLWRALAALTVLLCHMIPVFDVPWAIDLGHQAVIVFFVLSGYVICTVAETRERTWRVFLVARFARLWSVLVPAMALTILCDCVGRAFGPYPQSYRFSPIDFPLVRLGAALSFLTESWVSIQPFSNFPTWSLSIEFWFYMIFAAWTFTAPGRGRAITVGIAAVFSGHKGLLLLPIWLMGVALRRWGALRHPGRAINVALCLVGLALFFLLLASGLFSVAQRVDAQIFGPWLTRQVAEARWFWFDWLLGAALTMHLAGARAVLALIPIERIGAPVRWCAGISFSTYLFHMPLLHLFAAFLPRNQGLLAISGTLGVIALLGPPVERSKHWWRQQLARLSGLPPLSPMSMQSQV